MITPFDKALAAVIVGGISLLAMHFFAKSLTADEVATLTTLVTGLVVYLIPNKQ